MKYRGFTQISCVFLAFLLAVSLIFSSLVVGCSDAGISCEFDSNCGGGELCVENMCANPCTSDQQCEENTTCQVFIRKNEADQVHVCMVSFPADDSNNTMDAAQCSADEECREFLDSDDAICGLNSRCVIPEASASPDAPGVDSVMIRDRTPRELVDDTGHPGTVLSAVFVRDEGGSIVGYGDTLAFVPGVIAEIQPSGHLDGQPVQLNESGQCVAGDDPAMTALGGEGGYYLVGFVDYQGNRLSLGQGWKVIVIGLDADCSEEAEPQPDTGEYDVLLCVSSAGRDVNVEADCQEIIENVSGYTEFIVTTNG